MATRCDRGLSCRCSFSIFCLSASHENEKKNKQTNTQTKQNRKAKGKLIYFVKRGAAAWISTPASSDAIHWPLNATNRDTFHWDNGPQLSVGTVWHENGTLFPTTLWHFTVPKRQWMARSWRWDGLKRKRDTIFTEWQLFGTFYGPPWEWMKWDASKNRDTKCLLFG